VIDSLHPHNISICPNQTYTLPDQTVVNKAGTYYLTLKTQKGCDSVVYYNIKMLKSPADLTTSPDTCLNGSPVIRLRALPGYEMYWWNNMPSTNTFSEVHAPGVYTVMVENLCGSKTDTIRVYDGCDLPVYFPNAFTPNGDNLNDILKLPSLNRYKLIRLKIFNRWGQMVFMTTRPNEGWDGKTGGRPQATGTYVYFLELESLSGKRSTSNGTVLLIR
jgi:gliding motility-associated-like protein